MPRIDLDDTRRAYVDALHFVLPDLADFSDDAATLAILTRYRAACQIAVGRFLAAREMMNNA